MLKKIMAFVEAYTKDENGATAIEYGIIAALIAVVLITALTALRPQIAATFATVTSAMTPS